jgi:hypothetical protein
LLPKKSEDGIVTGSFSENMVVLVCHGLMAMLDYQRDGGAVTPNPQVMAILIGRMVMKQMERGTLRIRQTHLANDR